MKTHWTRLIAPGLCTLALLGLAGCKKQEVENSVDTAGKSIEKGVEKAVPTVQKAVEKAVPVIEKGVAKGAKTAVELATTGKVKAAFIADKTIPASEIGVSTSGNVIFLTGTVKSAAQKHQASVVAQKTAGGGYAIKNELKIAGGNPVPMKKK